MKYIVLVLLCMVLSSSGRHFKFWKVEKTERFEVSEFDMGGRGRKVQGMARNTITYGNVTNCGSNSTKFSMQWSPAILDTQATATFYWYFVAPVSINMGKFHIDVYLPEIKGQPIFSMEQKGTCAQIKKAVSSVNCPIKANDILKGQITASDLTRLPTGNYTIEMKITNEKDELFICGKASVCLKSE